LPLTATLSPAVSTPVAIGTLTPVASDLVRTPKQPTARAAVTRTVDGDTLGVLVEGSELEIRLLGVDAAETVDTARPDGYCGAEASARLAALLPVGATVELESDTTDLDRFGRSLRYVWIDGVMANAVLLAEGLAVLDVIPPDVAWVDEFVLLQDAARSNQLGLWGEGTCAGEPSVTPAPLSGSPGPGEFAVPDCVVADCDCGHFDSREEAQWFHDTHDPLDLHRLDQDGDGEVCELTPG